MNILLPVGISFYTFQTLSYVIDVYKNELQAEKSFTAFALYISFFPQLVAGPIERVQNLLPQLKKNRVFDSQQGYDGLRIMALGYFKKLVIADNLALYVNSIYDNYSSYDGFVFIIATVLFAIQILCDFSGYTDIAIGCSMLLGITLMQNFKSPYFSTSLKDFWSRWHISLSTWFRDYVYIPLGGNRKGKSRRAANLLITFGLCGFWHGANLTFLLWGLMHGLAQLIENLLPKKFLLSKNLFIKCIRWFYTFSFFCLTLMVFRAPRLYDANQILSKMFIGLEEGIPYFLTGFSSYHLSIQEWLFLLIPILILVVIEYYNYNKSVINCLCNIKKWKRILIEITFVLVIVVFSYKGTPTDFVYFQF